MIMPFPPWRAMVLEIGGLGACNVTHVRIAVFALGKLLAK